MTDPTPWIPYPPVMLQGVVDTPPPPYHGGLRSVARVWWEVAQAWKAAGYPEYEVDENYQAIPEPEVEPDHLFGGLDGQYVRLRLQWSEDNTEDTPPVLWLGYYKPWITVMWDTGPKHFNEAMVLIVTPVKHSTP